MPRTRDGLSPFRRALIISVIYALVAVFWVMIDDWLADSDWLSAMTADGRSQFAVIDSVISLVFVLFTTALLFTLIYRQFRRYRDAIVAERAQAGVILELRQFQEGVINNSSTWVSMIDPLGHILAWNRAAEKITGYTRDEVLNGNEVWRWLYPDENELGEIIDVSRDILHHALELRDFETCLLNRQGVRRNMLWNVRRVLDSDGKLAGSVALGVDITERRATETALKTRERQLVAIMDNLPGMAFRCLYDEHWTLKFASEGCRELTGYDPYELLDNRHASLASLVDPDDEKVARREVERAIASAEPYTLEYLLVRRNGKTVWVWEKGRPVEVDDELVIEGIMLDISDRKAMEQELAHLATHDPLTGLLNRRELQVKLDK